MKCLFLLSVILLFTFVVNAGQSAEPKTAKKQKAIIIYYSQTGMTRTMAEFIRDQSGFDIEEIKPVQPYTAGFHETVEQTRGEYQREHLPPLHPLKADLDSYDMVLLGSPLWWYTLSLPVMSFLSEHDLSGKIVVPFCTRGTSPAGPVFAKVAELCPGARILEGFDITRGKYDDSLPALRKWIKSAVSEIEQ